MSIMGAAIVGTLGRVAGGLISSSGARSANSSNARIAREQMAFQERMVNKAQKYQTSMSNTSYQRAVKDLQKAGLNPMLAYSQGGASTPSSPAPAGASATMVNEGEGIGQSIAGLADTYADLVLKKKQSDVMESQIDLNSANAYKAYEEAGAIPSQIDNNLSSAEKHRADAATAEYYQKLIKAQTARERSETRKIEKQIEQIAQLVDIGRISKRQAMLIADGLEIGNSLERLRLPGRTNESSYESSAWGQSRRYLNDALDYIERGAGLADAFGNIGDGMPGGRRPRR